LILFILSVALAAWLGGGAVAYGTAHARYGLTPSIAWLILAVAAAVAARRRPVAILALVLLLPWVPLRVPAAFLIWTGHAAVWVGALIAAAVAAQFVHQRAPVAISRLVRDPKAAPVLAFAAATVLFLAAAWRVSPQLPEGDEPHYLVITQSLLSDHDLQIENNHRRGDYHAYFQGELRPDYLQRGINGQIYSIHAPGLPAIVAPVFALLGYPGVVIFLVLVNAAAAALAWTVAWRVTGSAAAAWFGWSVVALSEPYFVQTFMIYPDAIAGAIVMFALATLTLDRQASVPRLAMTGVALALLPWLHMRTVILALPLAVVIAARHGTIQRLAAFSAAPIASAVGWFGFFWSIYGTLDPRAPYGSARQMALDSLPRGAVGLLFDQQFGLLPNAPVYLCAAAGLVVLVRRHRRLAIQMIIALSPYAATVAAFQMWWAGYTTPARFLVPVLLPLAIPAAVWFNSRRSEIARGLGISAVLVSALITATVVVVDRGALLLNFRDGASRLLTWLSPIVDLTTAAPSLFQSSLRIVLLQSAVWLGAVAVTVATAIAVSHRRASSDRSFVAIGSVAMTMTMIAATVVWRSHGAEPVKSDGGALEYLSAYDGDARQLAVSLSPLRAVRRADVPPRLPIVDVVSPAGDVLAFVRRVPAARYSITLHLMHPTHGTLTASLDRALGPDWRFDVTGTAGIWSQDIFVPVSSPVLIVDSDAASRTAIDRITIRATTVPGSAHRLTNAEADHVGRYGAALMFLMDGGAFMEPHGVWIQGASSADLAMATDDGRPVQFVVRTPPVANRVTFDGDGWRKELKLAAGESTTVDVPVSRFRITVEHGARPIDFEPGSTDIRFLGAWIEPQERR